MTSARKIMTAVRPVTLSLVFGTLIAGVTANASAQVNQQEPTITKGTVAEVIRKGRATSIVILSEAGGDPITVPITPRVKFAVEAKGDLGFLAEKQVVSGQGTLTNKSLFVKKWTVHVGLSAKKIKPFVKESSKAVGQSQNSYDFAGTISTRQQDKDYPDYETVITNIAKLKRGPIYIDKGATVTVSMTETELVEEGAKIEYIAQFLKGGRIQVTALRVLIEEPMKAEEFFKKQESKSTRRRTSS
ncbi:MAG: hypothetical protein ACI93T_003521 [Porticoccaceae bacterium]